MSDFILISASIRDCQIVRICLTVEVFYLLVCFGNGIVTVNMNYLRVLRVDVQM